MKMQGMWMVSPRMKMGEVGSMIVYLCVCVFVFVFACVFVSVFVFTLARVFLCVD